MMSRIPIGSSPSLNRMLPKVLFSHSDSTSSVLDLNLLQWSNNVEPSNPLRPTIINVRHMLRRPRAGSATQPQSCLTVGFCTVSLRYSPSQTTMVTPRALQLLNHPHSSQFRRTQCFEAYMYSDHSGRAYNTKTVTDLESSSQMTHS